jgi:hypothetical protein
MNKVIILFSLVTLTLAGVLAWFLAGELTAGQEAKQKLVEFEAQAGRLAENKELLAAVSADGDKIEAYFVNNQTLPNLIESLEALASTTSAGLNLTQATVEDQTTGAKLRLELVTTGSFSQVTNYLARLETMPYELVFKQARLSQGAAGEKFTTWQAQISLELLSYHNNDKN